MMFNKFYKFKVYKLSLVIFLFLIGISLFAQAEVFIAFGPQNFIRQKGSSSTIINNFSIINPNTDFVLRVYNGGQENLDTELAGHSIISINGVQVIGVKDLNHKVKFVEKPVILQTENTIEVEVKGKPGGLISVVIVEQDNVVPNIIINNPLNEELTNLNPYNIKLSFSDDTSGINLDSFEIFINGTDETEFFTINSTGISGEAYGSISLSEGINNIESNISDFAGNTSSVSNFFTVDTIPPEIINLFPNDGAIISNNKPIVSADFVDILSGIDIPSVIFTNNDTIFTEAVITSTGAVYAPVEPIPEGSHNIVIDLKDKAGNQAVQAKWSFIVDTVPPLVNIDDVSSTNISNFNVTGTYIEENISTITVNGVNADINKEERTYSLEISLSEGSHNIEVIATDIAGNTAGVTAIIVLDTLPPNPPQEIVVTVGDTILNLNWLANPNTESDFAGYNLYRSIPSGEEYNKLNNTLIISETYQDTNLTNGTMYYYVLTSEDALGNESGYSEEVFGIPQAAIGPQVIAKADLVNGFAPLEVNFSADCLGEINLYEWDFDGDGTYDFSSSSTADTNYTYMTMGIFEANIKVTGSSDQTATDTLTINVTLPPPTGLTATSGNTQINLDWDINPDFSATGYNVYRAENSLGPYTKINSQLLIQNLYQDNSVTNDLIYYYVVTLVDESENESAYSSEVSATPIGGEELLITDVFDTPDPISPNGDGYAERSIINYILTKDGKVTIKIYDELNVIIRTLKENVIDLAGENSIAWDGKNSAETLCEEGIYTYKIDAVDLQNNPTLQKQGTITLAKYLIKIISPVEGSILINTATFTAVNSKYVDGMISAVRFTYPSSYIIPIYLGEGIHQPDGSWTFDWDTTRVSNGAYQISARIHYTGFDDDSRYEYSVPVEYTIENEIPEIINLKVTPDPFSPDESGTWVDINTGVVYNEPGLDRVLDDIAVISFESSIGGFYDIRILEGDNTPLFRLHYGDLYPNPENNQIKIEWNGGGVKNGEYIVEVLNTNFQDTQRNRFLVDKMPFITQLRVFPNPFLPYECNDMDKTTINYILSENSYITIEIYQNDNLVRTLLNKELLFYGIQNHIWEGKDDNGGDVFGDFNIKIIPQAETGSFGPAAFIDVSISDITGIYTSVDNINPYLSDTVNISYTMGREGNLSIKIYNDEDFLIRTLISGETRAVGEHTEVWDGKTDSGNIVPDGPYYFEIEDIINDFPIVIYTPRGTGGKDVTRSMGLSAADYDPLINKFCVLTYNLLQPARVNLRVRYDRYDGPALKVIKYFDPTPSGEQIDFWDGRDEIGDFVKYSELTFAGYAYTLDNNSIIVTGGTPIIKNPSISPIKFTPYSRGYNSNISVNQATINFDLSRESNVTINIYNSSGFLVRTITNDTQCDAGQNSFVWDGKDYNDNYVSNDYFRIMIQALYSGNYSEPVTLHSEIYY